MLATLLELGCLLAINESTNLVFFRGSGVVSLDWFILHRNPF